MDVRDIAYGDSWQDILRSKLHDAERVMVFWSRHAAESEWVKEEWELALEDGKRLIPVPIDETPLPAALSQFHALTDLIPLLKPVLDQPEQAQHQPKTAPMSRYGMLAVAASLLLVVPTMLFLTTGPSDDPLRHIDPPTRSPIDLGPSGVQPLPPPPPPTSTVDISKDLVDGNGWIVALGGLLVLTLVSWGAMRWSGKRSRTKRPADNAYHDTLPEIEEVTVRTPSPDSDLGKRIVDMVFAESEHDVVP